MRTLKPSRTSCASRDSTGGDSFKEGREEVTPDTGSCITWGIQRSGQLCLLEVVSRPSPKHQSWQSHRKGQASVCAGWLATELSIYIYHDDLSEYIENLVPETQMSTADGMPCGLT